MQPAAQRRAGFIVSRGGNQQSWASTQQRVNHIVQFAAWVNAHESASPHQRALADRMLFSVQSAQLGSIKLEVGSWFLARPSFLDAGEKSAAAMWFAKVDKIFTHEGPTLSSNLILQVGSQCLTIILNPLT